MSSNLQTNNKTIINTSVVHVKATTTTTYVNKAQASLLHSTPYSLLYTYENDLSIVIKMSVNYRSGHIFVCKLMFHKLVHAQRIFPLIQVYQLKYTFVIIFVRNLLKFLQCYSLYRETVYCIILVLCCTVLYCIDI